MPCHPAKARILLRGDQAKVFWTRAFTIKLLRDSTKEVSELFLGYDPGSSTAGAAVTDKKGKVYCRIERTVRNDITKKMKRRASFRKTRRSLKTRYRAPRFDNLSGE
jgi:hypothetical protein